MLQYCKQFWSISSTILVQCCTIPYLARYWVRRLRFDSYPIPLLVHALFSVQLTTGLLPIPLLVPGLFDPAPLRLP
jgi:hypothetical protein